MSASNHQYGKKVSSKGKNEVRTYRRVLYSILILSFSRLKLTATSSRTPFRYVAPGLYWLSTTLFLTGFVFFLQQCPRFTEWGNWTECTEPCGGGIRSRTRACVFGEIGDSGCSGRVLDNGFCNEHVCSLCSA